MGERGRRGREREGRLDAGERQASSRRRSVRRYRLEQPGRRAAGRSSHSTCHTQQTKLAGRCRCHYSLPTVHSSRSTRAPQRRSSRLHSTRLDWAERDHCSRRTLLVQANDPPERTTEEGRTKDTDLHSPLDRLAAQTPSSNGRDLSQTWNSRMQTELCDSICMSYTLELVYVYLKQSFTVLLTFLTICPHVHSCVAVSICGLAARQASPHFRPPLVRSVLLCLPRAPCLTMLPAPRPHSPP